MNPRGSSNDTDERSRRILRRGITYGERRQDSSGALLDAPSKDVGLLFFSYQSNIETQFEFLLRQWAAGSGFLNGEGEADVLIGPQLESVPKWPTGWNRTPSRARAFGRFVAARGGDYFFVPCLSFLRGL